MALPTSAPCAQRWIEYTLSASIMIVALAMSSGVREEGTLICLFSLMAVTQLSALVVELQSKEGTSTAVSDGLEEYLLRISPALLGVVTYSVCWTVLISSFASASRLASASGNNVPSFVFAAFTGTALLFTLFAVPFFVYQGRDFDDYWETELWFRCEPFVDTEQRPN